MRWQLRRAEHTERTREPARATTSEGDLLIGPHPLDSDLVGTFVVKP